VSGEVRCRQYYCVWSSDILISADDHSPWTVFLGCRATTVDSIPTHGGKRGLLPKGNVDGNYLSVIPRYPKACQTSTRRCHRDSLRKQGIRERYVQHSPHTGVNGNPNRVLEVCKGKHQVVLHLEEYTARPRSSSGRGSMRVVSVGWRLCRVFGLGVGIRSRVTTWNIGFECVSILVRRVADKGWQPSPKRAII